jgi:inner membrane protease subunit 2
MVKRLIGLENDVVLMPDSGELEKVPAGRCWVEGDNADKSADSRSSYGPVGARVRSLALLVCSAIKMLAVQWPWCWFPKPHVLVTTSDVCSEGDAGGSACCMCSRQQYAPIAVLDPSIGVGACASEAKC